MRQLIFFFAACAALQCRHDPVKTIKVYLSNVSLSPYDSVNFVVSINRDDLISDSIYNQYVSYHWRSYEISTPLDSFRIGVKVSGKRFSGVTTDTVLVGHKTSSVFCRFNFTSFQNIYNDPVIYQHYRQGMDINKLVDSLYYAGALDPSFISDSVPDRQAIEITAQ